MKNGFVFRRLRFASGFSGSALETCIAWHPGWPLSTVPRSGEAGIASRRLEKVFGGCQFWGGGTVERLDKYEVFLNCFRWADVCCCWMVIWTCLLYFSLVLPFRWKMVVLGCTKRTTRRNRAPPTGRYEGGIGTRQSTSNALFGLFGCEAQFHSKN